MDEAVEQKQRDSCHQNEDFDEDQLFIDQENAQDKQRLLLFGSKKYTELQEEEERQAKEQMALFETDQPETVGGL